MGRPPWPPRCDKRRVSRQKASEKVRETRELRALPKRERLPPDDVACGTSGGFARLALMAFLFSQPARAAADPPGLILNAAEAARQAMLRAARRATR
jgi:hypothetical protein